MIYYEYLKAGTPVSASLNLNDAAQIELEHSEYNQLLKNAKDAKHSKEELMRLALGMKFTCPNIYTIGMTNRWIRGISLDETLAMLPYGEEYALCCKPMGNGMQYIFTGSVDNNKIPGTIANFSDSVILPNFQNNKPKYILFDENKEAFLVKPEGHKKVNWRITGNRKIVDYILSTKDYKIYGAPWMFEPGAKHNKDNSGDQILYRQPGANQKIWRMEKPGIPQFSCRYVGAFNGFEQFSGAIEHLGKIYTLPENASSILEVIPGSEPKLQFISYLTADIIGPSFLRKFSKIVVFPEGLFYVPFNSDRFIILYNTGNVKTCKEPIIGVRKFKSAIYSTKLNSIILAPYNYPFLLRYNIQDDTLTSLYSFLDKPGHQLEKYSDIIALNPTNIFCIPFRRSSLLHIYIKNEQEIYVNEYSCHLNALNNSDSNYQPSFYIQGYLAGGKIYCIPYHAPNVATIEMDFLDNLNIGIDEKYQFYLNKLKKEKMLQLKSRNIDQDVIDEFFSTFEEDNKAKIYHMVFDDLIYFTMYDIFGNGGGGSNKFSKCLMYNGYLCCIPFDYPYILLIDPQPVPKFKEIKYQTPSQIDLFDGKGKFSSACIFHGQLFFIPYNLNYMLRMVIPIDNKPITQDIVFGLPNNRAKYCEGIALGDALYLIPNLESQITMITNKYD